MPSQDLNQVRLSADESSTEPAHSTHPIMNTRRESDRSHSMRLTSTLHNVHFETSNYDNSGWSTDSSALYHTLPDASHLEESFHSQNYVYTAPLPHEHHLYDYSSAHRLVQETDSFTDTSSQQQWLSNPSHSESSSFVHPNLALPHYTPYNTSQPFPQWTPIPGENPSTINASTSASRTMTEGNQPPSSTPHNIDLSNDHSNSIHSLSSYSRVHVGSPATTRVALSQRRRPAAYFCDVPGCTSKGFTTMHNFQYHQRSHQDSRPFAVGENMSRSRWPECEIELLRGLLFPTFLPLERP
ncbi:hypothetical protein E1B28_008033 [Marasmius oreades]|uniref:C2H2-type domain-containing protein n=1 Tax=Marasmius oreades TaxID=181124 RepID=A0A9P7S2T3_9AGAR|nr:uncharacterized protein E1B28_008033 [Marasmius oreades]KAG7094434.1 hypothetical protein E1B28_008033 [Marasmius oreades]